MDLWSPLLDIVVLLLAAMVLGALCERLRQSAILGYLLAGVLLGPNALNWMPSHAAVATIAELGVSLLLFTIGLEFSWRRLRGLGGLALGGGTLQVLLTTLVAGGVIMLFGFEWRASVALGAMIALSSTACVLRLLIDRADIDSVYGRNALGILLLQDMAVVPLVVVITVLGSGGSAGEVIWAISLAIGAATLFVVIAYLVFRYLVPMLLRRQELARNRELPILLAIVTAIGTAWASHRIGLSPAIGAFVAGIILAGSPFATQIRADITSLRTLFVTLFFSSIGMLADPGWAVDHWLRVFVVVVIIVSGKAAITCGVSYLFRSPLGHAVATGFCLAQVGEFSFVLADVAGDGGLIGDELFKLIVSVTIATLFLTPYFLAFAPHLTTFVGRLSRRGPFELRPADTGEVEAGGETGGHMIIVGFGPAGQRVAETLMRAHKSIMRVVELNPRSAAIAQSYGLQTYIGDATRPEVLEHLSIHTARVVAVTVPDPVTAKRIIEQVRAISSQTPVVVRARYHIHRWQLGLAGAQVVVDEEDWVGTRIASEVQKLLSG